MATEVAEAVRKEAVSYVAKAVIATAAGIVGVAGFGLWLYVTRVLPAVVGGVPRGAVMAFDRDDLGEDKCPKGWTPFLEARGRTVIGAGDPGKAPGKMAHDENNRPLKGFVLREHGGEQVLIGTIDYQSPRGVQPHSNLTPYVALFYCKKIDYRFWLHAETKSRDSLLCHGRGCPSHPDRKFVTSVSLR